MYALRDPYSKLSWLICLGYILLAGYALDYSSRRLPPGASRAIAALSAVGLAVGAWPILPGDLFWPQAKVAIPVRYAQTAQWFNSDHPGRIIEMPVAPNIFDTYAWGYAGAGINYNTVRNPILAPVFDFNSDANAALDDAFRNLHVALGDREAAYVLGLYGISYILYDGSINPSYFSAGYAARLQGALPKTYLAKRFGPIGIYAIDGSLINDIVCVPNRLLIGAHDLGEMGVACRTLNGCRGIAAISPATAAQLRVKDVLEFRTGAAARALERQPGWTSYELPSIVRQATPTEDIGSPPPSPSQKLEIIDYGNGSSTAGAASEGFLEFGSASGVHLHVAANTALADRRFYYTSVVRTSAPYTLCTRPGETSWLDISLRGEELAGAPALLALEYASNAVVPGVALIDLTNLDPAGNVQNLYQAPLRSSSSGAWFVRLFNLNGRETSAALTLRLTASGESAGGCAYFRSVIIARGREHGLQLADAPRAFDTPPPTLRTIPTSSPIPAIGS